MRSQCLLTTLALAVLNSTADSFCWPQQQWECRVTSVGLCLVDLGMEMVVRTNLSTSHDMCLTFIVLQFPVVGVKNLYVRLKTRPGTLQQAATAKCITCSEIDV